MIPFFDIRTKKETKPFSDKLKRYLTQAELAGVIADSFSHKQIAKLMASLGAFYPGTRIESIDHQELAAGFADDVWRDPVLFAQLESALDEAHETDLEEMRMLPVKEISALLSNIHAIFDRKGVGKLIWLLLKDSRPEVTKLVRPFLQSVYRYMKKLEKDLQSRIDRRERLETGRLTDQDISELKELIGSSYDELNRMSKRLEAKDKKIQKVGEERDRLKGNLSSLRREHEALKSNLGRVKKELAETRARMETFKVASKKMTKAEEKSLRHTLHDLEREHRKQTHELLEGNKKISRCEEELKTRSATCARLTEELQVTLGRKDSLEAQVAELTREKNAKDKPALLEPTVVPLPKEKGKRLGIFVDMQNIWIASKRLRRKIDFCKLLDSIVLGRHLVKAIAYVVVIPELDQASFFNMLKRKGFAVRYRTLIRRANGSAKGNWDTGMVVDAIHLVDEKDLDIVHVVSGDGDFVDLLQYLKKRGMRVEASGFPFNSAQDLVRCVDEFFPLTDEILEPEKVVV